ncbi:MAG: porin family protein [Alphaproteobacteria bacterium]|nr:porin family protein [Alphaproteobacteria bacterium]MBM3652513.1 porin family protein [Alphaproteobacteria bacterium]
MRKTLSAFLSMTAFLAAGAAKAADPVLPVLKGPPPPLASPWRFEFGTRYWFSSGNHKYDFYNADIPDLLISRLTFGDLTGHSAETFFRVDHESGVFLKGFLGGGTLASGKLNDEDTVAAMYGVYSNTVHVQSGGSLKYVTVDLGYNVVETRLPTGQPVRIGPFVGYNNFHERMNSFGCAQVLLNANLCATAPPNSVSYPTNLDGLDFDVSWNSLRVGLGGEVELLPGLRASLEAAWIHSWMWNTDYHNFRPEIRGVQQSGNGDGFQLEGLLAYDLTPRFNVGVGGRYWQFSAPGKDYGESRVGRVATPIYSFSQRYGFFLQAGYRFGGPDDPTGAGNFGPLFAKAEAEPHDWRGAYIGGHVGYGFAAAKDTTLAARSPEAAILQTGFQAPFAQRSDIAGFVGGGQIGYNWRLHPLLVAGLETDFAYANVGGSFGASANFGDRRNFATSTKRLLESLGTVRGRFGILPRDDMMLYVTGGFAYGQVSTLGGLGEGNKFCALDFYCSAGAFSGLATGWTAGAGFEYAIARNWSLKAEWLYVDLGRQNYAINAFGGSVQDGFPANFSASSASATHLIRTGLNYRIDWPVPEGPMIAAY